MCENDFGNLFRAVPLTPRNRHSFLFRGLMAPALCLLFLSFCEGAGAQKAEEDTFPLTVLPAPGGAGDANLSPPPGEYIIPKNDTVLLQGRSNGNPGRMSLWSGDASGTGCVVPLQMTGPKRVSVSFEGDALSPADSVPVFDVPEKGVVHAFLGSGSLYGWFSANRTHKDLGAGISHLFSAEHAGFPVFARPNLNFEHIMNGATADYGRSWNTPRTDPMQVRVLSPSCVEVHWPAATSSWKLDCMMRYTFTGDNAIDMDFEVTPRKDEAPKGWLLFMWASYMRMVQERTIHFRGTDGGGEKWMSFGSTGVSGAVAGAGQPDLNRDDTSEKSNIAVTPVVRFTLPFYYGLLDADTSPGAKDNAMAFIMMFDDPQSTRFAVWNWGDDSRVSAWDWQFALRNPEIGRTYHHRARMVYRRFKGEDDVLAQYLAWRDGLAATRGERSFPPADVPLRFAPGDDGANLMHFADKIAEVDRAEALREYKRLLGIPAYALLAAEGIDRVYAGLGDVQGRTAFWESTTVVQPGNGIFLCHLGLAYGAAGDKDKAVDILRRACGMPPDNPHCGVALGEALESAGNDEDALAEYRGVLAKSPESPEILYCTKNMDRILTRRNEPAARVAEWRQIVGARPDAALPQLHLGMALADAGDGKGAETAYREALRLRPERLEPKMRLGAVLAAQGDVEGGLQLVNETVDAAPDLFGLAAEALGRAAKARLSAGDNPGALALLRRAQSLSPADLRYCVALGDALEAAGKDDDALDEYRRVLTDSPESPESLCCARSMDGILVRRNDPAARVAAWRRMAEVHPDADLPQLYLGMALEDAGDGGGAESAYREVLRLRPEKQEAKLRLGAVLAVRGDVEGALRLVDEAVGATPYLSGAAAEACGHAAKARLSAGDTPGALALLRRAHNLSPTDPRFCVALGEALEAAGDDDGALGEYRRVLAEAPDSPESLCSTKSMEGILMRRNDPAARVAEWRQVVGARPDAALPQLHLGMALEDAGDGGGAEAAYRETLRLRPERQEPKLRLGALLAARGDVEGCLRLVDEAVGVTPDLSGPAAEASALAAKSRLSARDARGSVALLRRARSLSPADQRHGVALGEALVAAGEDDGALGEYGRVLAESPESPEAQICAKNMDGILMLRNDSAARVAAWRRMVEAHPDAALPQLHLGMALEDAGDGGGAEAAYREALRLRPEGREPKVRIGAVLAAKGDVEGGLRLVDEAVGSLPDLSGLAAEACGRAAKAHLSAGDTPGALALLRRARSLSPTDLRYRVALGGALEAAGDDDGALAEYRAVVAEIPESPRSSDQIDAILSRRKDVPGRVAEWRGAVERHPDAAVPHLHLGLALEASGDLPGARAAYGRALEIDPKLAGARNALDRINGDAAGSK